MGIEYKLSFAHDSPDQLRTLLLRINGASRSAQQSETIEFKGTKTTGEMPDASSHVEPYGLYFCDHGGGREFFGYVISMLTSQFGAITVEELE